MADFISRGRRFPPQGKYQHKPPFPYIAGRSHGFHCLAQTVHGRRRSFLRTRAHVRLSEFRAGAEFSGVISASSPIPDGCDFIPGKTRVFGAGQGAYAEKIAVDFRKLLEVPNKMSMEEAAGLYVTMPTSYAGLVNRAQIKEGDWVLVHVSCSRLFGSVQSRVLELTSRACSQAAAGGGVSLSLPLIYTP